MYVRCLLCHQTDTVVRYLMIVKRRLLDTTVSVPQVYILCQTGQCTVVTRCMRIHGVLPGRAYKRWQRIASGVEC
jgi:hypothetical protein